MTTKTLGEVEPQRRLTKEEREARKAVRAGQAQAALLEHQKEQKAFLENRERLKAERLARDSKKR
jgi:hypothetical protein